MTMRNAAPATLIALGLFVAAPAHTAPPPGTTTLRGWLGFTTLSLGDINSQIRGQQVAFGSDTLVDESRWDALGGAPNLGVELDLQLTHAVSGGLSVNVHRSSVSHQALKVYGLDEVGEPEYFESFDERVRISAWDVCANMTLWVPSAPGLHFGAQVGIVRGTYERDEVYQLELLNVLPDLRHTEGTFRGTGAVLGAYTGYEQALAPQLSLMTRMGYRYRQIARPLGTTYTTNWGDQGNTREWEDGPLLDPNGNPMSLDLGGFYVQVGLSARLGGN